MRLKPAPQSWIICKAFLFLDPTVRDHFSHPEFSLEISEEINTQHIRHTS